MDVVSDIMTLGRIRHLPVVGADGSVVGVVSQRDLFRAGISSGLGAGPREERRALGKIAVRDVMSSPAVTATPDEPLGDAIDRMLENRVGCLPVLDGTALVGILTETDALRACRRMTA